MEHQPAHVQRGAAGHLLGVAVVQPVRDRIAGQAAALTGAVVPPGHPVGHRQTRREQNRQRPAVCGTTLV